MKLFSFAIGVDVWGSSHLRHFFLDTFADLRSGKQQKEEILKSTCFYCGLGRSELDNKAISFEDNILQMTEQRMRLFSSAPAYFHYLMASSNRRPTPSFALYLPATPHKQKCFSLSRLVKFHSSERTICCCFHEKLFCYFASKFCSKYVKHPLENGVNLSKDGSNFFKNIYD